MDAELSARLIDQLQVGVILLDGDGRITFWNAWVTRHSGLAPETALGHSLQEVFLEVEGSRLQTCIEQALRFRLSSVMAPGLNGTVLPLYLKKTDRALDQRMQQLIYVTPQRHSRHACLIQILDMTAAIRRERRLRAHSSELMATTYRDPLTGVGNRRRLDLDLAELFGTAQTKQTSVALLMIDIDDFKSYNDHFGHPKGDECLTRVARALREESRALEDRLSRYGGEEFGLPLANTDLEKASMIAERLRLKIANLRIPHPGSRVTGHITVSIGVSAIIPRMDQTRDILIAQADLALYTAKDRGRNVCVGFDSEQNDLRDCC